MSTTEYRASAPVRRPKRPTPWMRAAVARVPAEVWWVGALVILAAALRFATLATQSYWADESLTVHEVRMPFGSMLSAVSHAETTPPLYFILAWRVALDGMFFQSTVLLRVVVLVGFIVALPGTGLAVYEIVDYFVEPGQRVAGFASLAVLTLLLAGFIIVSVGVVGIYVGRIFEQVKDRPLYLIDNQAAGPDHRPAGVEAAGYSSADRT